MRQWFQRRRTEQPPSHSAKQEPGKRAHGTLQESPLVKDRRSSRTRGVGESRVTGAECLGHANQPMVGTAQLSALSPPIGSNRTIRIRWNKQRSPMKLNIATLAIILVAAVLLGMRAMQLPWTPPRIAGAAIAAPSLLLLVLARIQ